MNIHTRLLDYLGGEHAVVRQPLADYFFAATVVLHGENQAFRQEYLLHELSFGILAISLLPTLLQPEDIQLAVDLVEAHPQPGDVSFDYPLCATMCHFKCAAAHLQVPNLA